MRQIRNFEGAREVLRAYIPLISQREAYTLERMTALMDRLGNPQEKYRVVHIAGTSGKTSTAYYIAAMLKAHGLKTGLTVSPHVDEVNERVQIGLKPLPEKIFCGNLTRFINLVEKTGIKPTYFELLVAFAYWYFAEAKVDYAVVEVGLGGLLDGTNVVDRADKVCVITDIGLDHTRVLGDNLPAIASQKAGIIRPGNTVFTYGQSSEIMAVFREASDSQQAELHEVVLEKSDNLPENLPPFQKRNWYLANRAVSYIARRDGLRGLSGNRLLATANTYVPARMEIVKIKGKTIVIDGSHNPQKLRALADGLRAQFTGRKFAVLIGMLRERSEQVQAAIQEIAPVTASITATSFLGGQDVPREPLDPQKIVELAETAGIKTNFNQSPEAAFQELLDGPENYILVTGSFFLLNHVRPILRETRVIFKGDD